MWQTPCSCAPPDSVSNPHVHVAKKFSETDVSHGVFTWWWDHMVVGRKSGGDRLQQVDINPEIYVTQECERTKNKVEWTSDPRIPCCSQQHKGTFPKREGKYQRAKSSPHIAKQHAGDRRRQLGTTQPPPPFQVPVLQVSFASPDLIWNRLFLKQAALRCASNTHLFPLIDQAIIGSLKRVSFEQPQCSQRVITIV